MRSVQRARPLVSGRGQGPRLGVSGVSVQEINGQPGAVLSSLAGDPVLVIALAGD